MGKKLINDHMIMTPEMIEQQFAHAEVTLGNGRVVFTGDNNKAEPRKGSYQFVPMELDVVGMFPNPQAADNLMQEHGIPDHVRSYVADKWCRCASCHKIQPSGSLMLWVADGLRRTDDYDVFIANCNGAHSSAWCVKCFPKPVDTRSALARFWDWISQ